VLNVSILDGWWCEGYNENRGWRIGNGEEYADPAYQDAVESQALYNVLENEVIPCFYDRKNGEYPRRWVRMMKESMKMGMQTFCSHRMVAEYDERFYEPARERMKELLADGAAEARSLAERRQRLTDLWHAVGLDRPRLQSDGPFRVGETMRVTAEVHLGELRPDDVTVELYFGVLKSVDAMEDARAHEMRMVEPHGGGSYLFACDVACERSGRYGFSARITPRGDGWTRNIPGLIAWA
jgi:glycogen phosphorylase